MMNRNRALHLFAFVFVLFLTVCLAAVAASAEETHEPVVVNVKDYGAVGDGVNDDVAAINIAALSLKEGDTLYFPAGCYLVKEYGYHGVVVIKEKRDVHIVFDEGAILQMDTVEDNALPKNNRHFVLHLLHCENVTVSGGTIYGDRLRYQGSARVDQGYGIRLSDCRNVTVRGTEIAYVRGDGIQVFSDTYDENGLKGRCFDITIDDCHIYDCFRNGITLTSVVGCVISNTEIHGIRGGLPQAAVDVEAEYPGSYNHNVTIEGCHFYDNGSLSVAVAGPSDNILIRDSVMENRIILDQAAQGLTLSGCKLEKVGVTGKNCVIEDCELRSVSLYGGEVTCRSCRFDGWDWIPYRVLVTRSEGTSKGTFENCKFFGKGLCALGGCIVFCESPPELLTFTDCGFRSCGLIPFLGKLNTVERSGCFFDLGPALWVCILGVGAAAFFLIRRRTRKKAKRVWRCT